MISFEAEEKNLRRHLQNTACLRDAFQNPEALAGVQRYIRAELESYGYKVREDYFEHEGKRFANLIASAGGEAFPEFVAGAHFDAVPGTPGADDNASGVAALLEAARCVSLIKPAARIHFAAFNLEEYGMAGSAHYAAELKKTMPAAERKKFLGMISLEMVGYTSARKGSQQLPGFLRPFYPDTGDFLALVGDLSSGALIKNAETAFKKTGLPVESLTVVLKGNEFPAVRLSDHSPFWDNGFPALLVTDTSFFRNPHYHLASDTVASLDIDFLKKVTDGAVSLLASLKPK